MIYLGVAQPRGLVVLSGAGKIAPSVREFLSTELKIRVEVPALEFSPTSQILGGANDGIDVLKAQVRLAETDPNVILGPDSIGTLSFTSGSTGIPKGVRGRHYSLTHFFPWMGNRFGLTETSKFTMLSGIAHDPIQRDSTYCIFEQIHLLMGQTSQFSRLSSWVQSFMYPPQKTSAHPAVSQNGWTTARLQSRT
jgi:L-aminoadipate-semialdehyde dehydrogenase